MSIEIADGFYQTIEPRQVVASAKMALLLESSDHDRYLELLVNNGAKRMSVGSSYLVQDIVLDVVNNEYVELPCDFDTLISLRYGSGNGCYGMIYVDLPFLKSCGCTVPNNSSHYNNYMRIEDGKIYFYYGITGPPGTSTPVTQVTLSYWAVNKDKDGLRVIYSDWEECLTHYVCWKFSNAYFKNYPAGWSEGHRLNYVAQKESVIGAYQQNQFRRKKRQIASTVNAIVVSKTWSH